MKITDKAKEFATMAHSGQIRKSEPDKPMIIHPIAVAEMLAEYGCDDETICAGYLHDVVEDTKYTIKDIEDNFGEIIADLVQTASEPDKSLSWEIRKQHTINEIRTKPLKNKFIVAADKIHNISSLIKTIKTKGLETFNYFKRGPDDQLWYFEKVYESLIYNEDPNIPMFLHLRKVLDELKQEIDYQIHLENEIFMHQPELYKKLQKLHERKYELLKLKQLNKLRWPFVVEFSGTPRTGKTSILNNLQDFFHKAGLNTHIVQEFTKTESYKNNIWTKRHEMSPIDYQSAIIKEVIKQLNDAVSNKSLDIILLDRSVFDRCIWNQRSLDTGIITKSENESFISSYLKYSQVIDLLVLTYADPEVSERRDFINSLTLEKRSFINIKNISEYNTAMGNFQKMSDAVNKNSIIVDTTNISCMDSSITIAEFIIKSILDQTCSCAA